MHQRGRIIFLNDWLRWRRLFVPYRIRASLAWIVPHVSRHHVVTTSIVVLADTTRKEPEAKHHIHHHRKIGGSTRVGATSGRRRPIRSQNQRRIVKAHRARTPCGSGGGRWVTRSPSGRTRPPVATTSAMDRPPTAWLYIFRNRPAFELTTSSSGRTITLTGRARLRPRHTLI
jgi:hypothetical protein